MYIGVVLKQLGRSNFAPASLDSDLGLFEMGSVRLGTEENDNDTKGNDSTDEDTVDSSVVWDVGTGQFEGFTSVGFDLSRTCRGHVTKLMVGVSLLSQGHKNNQTTYLVAEATEESTESWRSNFAEVHRDNTPSYDIRQYRISQSTQSSQHASLDTTLNEAGEGDTVSRHDLRDQTVSTYKPPAASPAKLSGRIQRGIQQA